MSDYYHAINSAEWFDEVRPAVLDRDHHRCRFCGCTNNLQVHHIRYQNDQGEPDYSDLKYLVTLCRKCHKIVSDAVNEAKQATIVVPAFMIKPGVAAIYDDINKTWNKIKLNVSNAEADLIAETCFKIWQRTLDDDCGVVNLRNLNVLKPIGEIVRASIEYQTELGGTGYNAAFAERTINLITQYIAEGYNRYRSDGHSDSDVQRFFKLNPAQMIRVRKQAERLRQNGAGASG